MPTNYTNAQVESIRRLAYKECPDKADDFVVSYMCLRDMLPHREAKDVVRAAFKLKYVHPDYGVMLYLSLQSEWVDHETALATINDDDVCAYIQKIYA